MKQIEGIVKDNAHINSHTTKFYNLVKKLCQDHYGWIRAHKFAQVMPAYKPNTAWISPTASNSRTFDFFTTESGRKLNETKTKKGDQSVII